MRFARRLERSPAVPLRRARAQIAAKKREGIEVSARDRRPRPADAAGDRGGCGEPHSATRPPISTPPTTEPTSSVKLRRASIGDRFGVKLDPASEVVPALGGKKPSGTSRWPVSTRAMSPQPEPGYPPYTSARVLRRGHPLPALDAGERVLPGPGRDPEETAGRSKLLYLNYPEQPDGAVVPEARSSGRGVRPPP